VWDGVKMSSSRLGGRGLFATRPFRAGETIRRIRLLRPVSEASPLAPGEDAAHLSWIDGGAWLTGEPDRYVNHSCEPTAWKRFDADGGPDADMVALVDLEPGREITYDYGLNTHGGSQWACACGAPTCRGLMAASWFDLPLGLRRRQRPRLAPWFVRRHAERLAREGLL
jgi:hypothetical protein